ncbi:response regulator [Halovulum sp. GXIMD14793]
MDEFELKPINAQRTARRKCLLGVTIMLVEDSLCASEALRLMAVASGARLRRADCLTSAKRHLAVFRPNVVMVDLGLPDGDGLDLISTMAKSVPSPAVIAFSGGDLDDWGPAARHAGADATLVKPVGGIAAFQDCILSVLEDGEERRKGHIPQPFLKPAASADAIREDLRNARELLRVALATRDPDSLNYASQFVDSIAAMLRDHEMEKCVSQMIAAAPGDLMAGVGPAADLMKLLEKRFNWDDLGAAAQ